MLEFREIFMQIFRNALTSGFDDSVPFVAIIVFGQGQPIHYQVIFHLLFLIKLLLCNHNDSDHNNQCFGAAYFWYEYFIFFFHFTLNDGSQYLFFSSSCIIFIQMTTKVILLVLTLLTLHHSTTAQFCSICELSVSSLSSSAKFMMPTSWIAQGIQIMCVNKFDNQKLCKGIGEELAPIAKANLIKNFINPHHWCSLVCQDTYKKYSPDAEVDRILNGGAPNPLNLQNFVEREQISIAAKSSIKILHLSDIHLDMNYTEGASINCDYPICCHQEDGFPESTAGQAGPYGNKNCDCPLKLLDSLLSFLSTKQHADIVIATGDFSAHNQWEKNKQTIAENQQRIYQRIKSALKPELLLQAVGNNDYSPDHQYDPKVDSKLMKIVKVRVGQEILTFISLNTMVYDDMNMFVFGDQSYPIFQLNLLEQELANSDNVILMGHVPPTLRGAAPEFQAVYRALIAKYSSKIKGQFFGHTHMDMLTLNTYPDSPDVATGFGFIAPSVSPYGVNLSRTRVYNFGVSPSAGVIDYVQYKNKDISAPVSEWITEYSFRNKYKLEQSENPLTIEQMANIKGIIHQNIQIQEQYQETCGLPKERRKERIHCQISDDAGERRKCYGGRNLANPDLFRLIDLLRGSWGYDVTEIK